MQRQLRVALSSTAFWCREVVNEARQCWPVLDLFRDLDRHPGFARE